VQASGSALYCHVAVSGSMRCARAGVDDSTEPRGEAGADAVVVGSKCRIGLKLAAETDLHLPGEGKYEAKTSQCHSTS
jgi:hypothetical protein